MKALLLCLSLFFFSNIFSQDTAYYTSKFQTHYVNQDIVGITTDTFSVKVFGALSGRRGIKIGNNILLIDSAMGAESLGEDTVIYLWYHSESVKKAIVAIVMNGDINTLAVNTPEGTTMYELKREEE